ncbi:MAG: bifunctional phosphopantothenoylcysteine decarboxylase/phosphopantothenate--cysteine ligase CoaBC [Flavobacteriales bacterium]|nr:bifunctional phosphopantothenoylcysteine decarboxylase/phosphopantothenate--cysteine ligase CoaBC [Flavobacteriales bacterium]|tara:strand:+ start:308 stop:1552 length:1245 start_codon:yes stop_codon:yes gene_type:complete
MDTIYTDNIFFGKKILIGVTGSIAAYKIPELIRIFIKKGAEVKVILTNDAINFVTPLTISTISKNDVIIDFLDDSKSKWNNHIELSLWADFFLIAPATANTISKMANGQCDNILLATFLSATCPIYCAPSMDRDMYLNKSTLKNIEIIKSRGINIFNVEKGELASGLFGLGRMLEISKIVANLENILVKKLPLFGYKFLITAGPTYEKIDPVRFIGNLSSGKMGCELARQAADYGACVDLILGPSKELVNHPLVNTFNVFNADEMLEKCENKFRFCDVAIFSAAVSDFKPTKYINKKIKNKSLTIKTSKNPDICKLLGNKKNNQFIVGFALETDNEENNAIQKLKNKNLDLIVLNSLKDSESCFGYDTNKIKIIDDLEYIKSYPLMKKSKVAKVILDEVLFKINYNKSINNVLK